MSKPKKIEPVATTVKDGRVVVLYKDGTMFQFDSVAKRWLKMPPAPLESLDGMPYVKPKTPPKPKPEPLSDAGKPGDDDLAGDAPQPSGESGEVTGPGLGEQLH